MTHIPYDPAIQAEAAQVVARLGGGQHEPEPEWHGEMALAYGLVALVSALVGFVIGWCVA